MREIPDSKAFGRGLHEKDFPVTFGIVDRLEFAGFTLRDVPVMLMPDDALLFETSRGQFPVPMVLGLHLLKEFTMDLDYGHRRITLTRADFRGASRIPIRTCSSIGAGSSCAPRSIATATIRSCSTPAASPR